jgi:superfamily II DNA or RNA helicase
MELRPYQRTTIDEVKAALGRRPILVAPTGAGKSVMGARLVQELARPTLWLAHRKELIEQAADHLERLGLVTGIIKAGVPPMPLAPVQVASVSTLARRTSGGVFRLPGLCDSAPSSIGLIVIDECHHATADSYREIIERYEGVPVVGLTATPFRLDGHGLGDLFGELVVAATTAELCRAGYLHSPKVWAGKSPDLRGVKVTGGDYNLGQLARRVNTAELTGDIVAEWQKRAAGRRTVAFAVDVDHSRQIAAAFAAAGIPAEHLDGGMKDADREAVLSHLASGRTLIVSNCMVLTEGFDLPALECAIIARPTASLNLHLQMVGRIMRSSAGKDGAIVLDHAGNHHIHGLVTRPLEYHLDGRKRTGESEPLGLRRCKRCGLFFELTVYACPECGWVPTAEECRRRREPGVSGSGDLAPFDDSTLEYRCEVWDLIEAEREAMGYREGWSVHRFRERFGVDPVVAGGELIDPLAADGEQKRAVYARLVETAAMKGFKSGWAAHQYRRVFGVWPRGFVSDLRRDELRKRFAERAAV